MNGPEDRARRLDPLSRPGAATGLGRGILKGKGAGRYKGPGKGRVTTPAVVIIPSQEWVRDRAFLLMIWVLHAFGALLIGLGMAAANHDQVRATPSFVVLNLIPYFPTSLGGLIAIGGLLGCIGLARRGLRKVAAVGFYLAAAGLSVFGVGLALAWSELATKHSPFIYAVMAGLYAGIAMYLGVGRADK